MELNELAVLSFSFVIKAQSVGWRTQQGNLTYTSGIAVAYQCHVDAHFVDRFWRLAH
jgi:hypothetical protein